MHTPPAAAQSQLNLLSCRKGYTLMELIVVLAVLALFMGIAFPSFFAHRDRVLLKTTAAELESSLMLARQLSMDENREYVVELMKSQFRVRQNWAGAPAVVSIDYPPGIKRNVGSHTQVVYGRDGLTGYGKFVLENRRKQRMMVEIHIGTGRVTVSDIY
ncbi:MAG: prepilin-type N-terminal cleavage/methylation domain-containing protein [Bacillota bacterium]|nr:prepilin-type N-terminal cleavage/methylation domain-containing protein [Bacillota bacterium]MDW7677216.1 prepilin-type N-terminal cleavage/methylation domain-containing protein [Bacillota bacterium]